jgi:uncharacterized membrane protein
MYNVVNGARYLMFGSDNRMGLYVGVLLIWLVLCWLANLIFYIVISLHVVWKKRKAKQETEETAGGIVTQDIQEKEDVEKNNVELKEIP